MNGLDIQFLDGLDIQFLDGKTRRRMKRKGAGIFKNPRVQHRIKTDPQFAQKAGELIDKTTTGITANSFSEVDTLIHGFDFAGFEGDHSIEDDEKTLNYLQRTRRLVNAAPQMFETYQNPAELKRMLGYVIANWDTADREAAIENAANEEQRLVGLGAIANRNGFFGHLQKTATNPLLSKDTHEVALSLGDFLLRKKKRRIRSITASARRKRPLTAVLPTPETTPDEQPAVKTIIQNAADTESVNGLGAAADDDFNYYLHGYHLANLEGYTGDNRDISDYNNTGEYLQGIRDMVAENPSEYFDTPSEMHYKLGVIDAFTSNWHNPEAVAAIAEQLERQNEDEDIQGLGLLKKIKKAAKKVGSSVKKVAKKAVKVVKKVAAAPIKAAVKVTKAAVKVTKKIAKKVKKIVKKAVKVIKKVLKAVVKFIIKFNPLTMAARGGLLLACKRNMFKISAKLFPYIATPEEVLRLGYSQQDIDKSQAGLCLLAV